MDETRIGARTRVRGQVDGDDPVVVFGEVEGSVATGSLRVAPEGRLAADVQAVDVVIEGAITGQVTGTKKVEIRPGARMIGDVRTARILISDGAHFRGRVEMDLGEG